MTDEDSNKGGIICCLLLLVPLIILFMIGSSYTPQVPVYFDNGYDNDFDIFVDGIKEGSVGPLSMEEISIIEEGEHRIEIRKKNGRLIESCNVTLTEYDKYIYNIGGKYFYYIEICEYHVKGGTKWGGWDTKDIGSDTLMEYPDADYGFDENCPKSVRMYKDMTSDTRTKLKRGTNPSALKIEKDWHSGSGGGALDVGQTSSIEFDSPRTVERAYIKVGCNDDEKMDGYIEHWDGQEWTYLASFSDVGCGDYINFTQVTTSKLKLTMTGGGGDDERISWHCCGSAGWKVYSEADEEKEEKNSPEAQLENSLVGYWNFDEDSGDIASDVSGNGNDGTIHGAKLVDGKYGTALEFDGKDDYVHIPNSKTLQDLTESDFTFEAWVKPSDVPPHTNTNNRHYGIITRPGWHTGLIYRYDKQFSFSLWDSSNTVFGLGSQVYEPGGWHHVVGVTDDSSKNMYIYIDGVLANSSSYSGSLKDYRTLPYRIGAGHNSGDYKWYFNGIIDEVRIYNYALTESEIKDAARHHDTSSVTTKAFYAQKIISSDIRGSENQHKEPDAALGPPDAQSGHEGYVSLGGEGWIIVDMGKDIVDGTGYDLEIYELGSSYPDSNNEAYKIFASKYSDKDWIYLGKGSDISGFDLADAGVDSVRYVKITDDTGTNSGKSPGADIDAIAGFLH